MTFCPFDLSSGGFASTAISVLAYLDPGTGSYALQILLATLFGGMFALKQSWSELKVWLSRFRPVAGPAGSTPEGRAIESLPQNIARPRVHGQSTAEIR